MKLPPAASLPVSGGDLNTRSTWPMPPAPVLPAKEQQNSIPSLPKLLVTILLILCSPHAMAEKPEDIETRISLLAIGDPPVPRFEIRDERRHLLDTPVSEYPPAEVLVREKRGDNEAFKTVPLGLNSPTGYITYRGERKLVLFRKDQNAKKSVFSSIDLPELRDDLTLILVRDRRSKSWQNPPLVHAFDNSLAAFPNDSVRLINLSAVPVRAKINEGRLLEIAPGRHTIVRIPRNDQGVLTYRLAAVFGEDFLPLIDSATTTMPDARFNLIIYNADSTHARAPVNLASYFERPPQKDTSRSPRPPAQ